MLYCELDFVALFGLEAYDVRDVEEYVLVLAFLLDESVTLLVVKELYSTSYHSNLLWPISWGPPLKGLSVRRVGNKLTGFNRWLNDVSGPCGRGEGLHWGRGVG